LQPARETVRLFFCPTTESRFVGWVENARISALFAQLRNLSAWREILDIHRYHRVPFSNR